MFGNPSYPTYQAFLGLGIAAAIALLLMPWWIKLLKVEGIGQQVRADGPKRHLIKQGTPTMGGVIILVAVSLTCLLMGKLTTELVLVLLATLATGVLGLIDDLTSVTHGRSLGLTPHAKMIGLTIICVTFTVLAVNWCGVAPEIRFPGGLTIDLGVLSTTICGLSFPWLYIVFCWLMIAGLSNAVNLTDGLDGLAGGTSMIAMLAMAAMAFLHGDVNLSIFCTACAGACLGFLWFNCYPASIFMGDTGSLTIGGIIGKVVSVDTEYEEIVVDSEGSQLRFGFNAISREYVRPAYVHDDEVDENGNPLSKEDEPDQKPVVDATEEPAQDADVIQQPIDEQKND